MSCHSRVLTRLVAAVILAFWVVPAARGQAAAEDRPPVSRLDMPSFGLSVSVPGGFVRDTDAQNTVAIFIPADATPGQPNQLLWLDVFAKEGGSLSDFAKTLSEDGALATGRKDAKWGDRPAIELVATRPPGDKRSPVRQLLAERDGYLYRLQYAATGPHANQLAAYEQVAKETRWIPFTSAGKAVAKRNPSFALGNGMVVNVPDPFRPDMRRKSQTVKAFLAQDMTSGKGVAKLTIIPMPKEEGPYTLDGLKKEAADNLAGSLRLKEPFRWEQATGTRGSVTFVATPRLATEDGWVQVMAASQDGKVATVFSLQCTDAKAGEGMERVVPLLTESISESATVATRPAEKGR